MMDGGICTWTWRLRREEDCGGVRIISGNKNMLEGGSSEMGFVMRRRCRLGGLFGSMYCPCIDQFKSTMREAASASLVPIAKNETVKHLVHKNWICNPHMV